MADTKILDPEEVKIYKEMQKSPLLFIRMMWKLIPQPVKKEHEYELRAIISLTWDEWEESKKLIQPSWFEPFEKGKHITWQQWLIMISIEKALKGEGSRKISIASGHGVGKLHSYSMRLPTPSGERRWGDLKVGDYVFDNLGIPTKIIETHHYKNVPMYRVSFDDGSFCDVSSGHLWNVRGRNERRKKLTTWRTLETLDLVNIGIKRSNGISSAKQWEIPIQGIAQFPIKETAIHPYLVGVWIGDGTKNLPQYTKPHTEIREKIQSLGYEVSPRKDGLIYIQKSHSLFQGGVFDKHSSDRYIPDEYKFNSYENRLALFQGLCDTDGECNSSGSIGYSTTSKRLADDMVWLARSLGCKAKIQETIKKGWYRGKDGERINCKDCYRITINAPFNPFTIKKRKDKYKPSEERYLKRWIESIELITNEDGMCITVENENGLYLANDFIVTHNSSSISWVILWFLFCFLEAQVPCTAPTADQMYDVLWKELNIWIDKMPPGIKERYEWQTNYIRMIESPATWFARAKTASKENSEALAGVHSDHVLTIADEASGVPEQIFNTAEGAWTSGNILVLLISNPTRINGYFYDTHHKLKKNWQTMQFSSIDSPIVDHEYQYQIAERHGTDSTEYGIRVLGKFPNEDTMDDTGYVALLTDRNINMQPDFPYLSWGTVCILGVDPSGDGDDKTSWVLRDQFKSKEIHTEQTSNSKTIAEKTITFMEQYKIDPRNVVIDGFGVGMNVGKEIAIATKGNANVTVVNTGEQCEDEKDQELYLNKRAEGFYKGKQWLQSGGEIVENSNFKEELLSIKYKRNLKGKIQIMPKIDMKRRYGLKSPNAADAFSLTFLRDIPPQLSESQREAQRLLDEMDFDPFAVI